MGAGRMRLMPLRVEVEIVRSLAQVRRQAWFLRWYTFWGLGFVLAAIGNRSFICRLAGAGLGSHVLRRALARSRATGLGLGRALGSLVRVAKVGHSHFER